MLKMVIETTPTAVGIAEAIRELEELRESLAQRSSQEREPSAEPAIVTLYLRSGEGTRSREFLETLPAASAGGMTPVELGAAMAPDPGGSRLEPANVRAVLRNVLRARLHLREEGRIPSDLDLVCVDWSGYESQGAGRYFLTDSDHAALHDYLSGA